MKKYCYESRVRFSEVDEFQNLTLYSLLNYLQDCATFHGEDIGLSLSHNMQTGNAWIIADMQLKIFRMAHFNDRILVKTWADKFRGVIGHRCFSIETEAGEMLALVNSDWVFMDMKLGLPTAVPKEQIEGYGEYPELKIEEDLGKRKVRVPGEGEDQRTITIQESHLDANKHMNNAQYVRLASKYLPTDFHVGKMRVEWKKQAHLGDTFFPKVLRTEDCCYVQFLDANGEVYFVAEFCIAPESAERTDRHD